jgi:hypothetical protein
MEDASDEIACEDPSSKGRLSMSEVLLEPAVEGFIVGAVGVDKDLR